MQHNISLVRSELLCKVGQSPQNEDALILWDLTLKEVDEGLLQGPSDISRDFGEAWLPVRRFGVWQNSGGKSKFRPIDDFAENTVNSSFSYVDKLDLRALDETVAIAREWGLQLQNPGHIEFCLQNGRVVRGTLHPTWQDAANRSLLLSTLDLKKCLQAVATERVEPGLVNHQLERPSYGERGVLRVARSSFRQRCVGCSLQPVLAFVAPFGGASPCALDHFHGLPYCHACQPGSSTRLTLETLVKLLGFPCSWDKFQNFDGKCATLGVELDFSELEARGVLIRNKEGRASEVYEYVREKGIGFPSLSSPLPLRMLLGSS